MILYISINILVFVSTYYYNINIATTAASSITTPPLPIATICGTLIICKANILHTHYLIPKQPHDTVIIPINCGPDLLKRPGQDNKHNTWQNQDSDTGLL